MLNRVELEKKFYNLGFAASNFFNEIQCKIILICFSLIFYVCEIITHVIALRTFRNHWSRKVNFLRIKLWLVWQFGQLFIIVPIT